MGTTQMTLSLLLARLIQRVIISKETEFQVPEIVSLSVIALRV